MLGAWEPARAPGGPKPPWGSLLAQGPSGGGVILPVTLPGEPRVSLSQGSQALPRQPESGVRNAWRWD